MQQVWPKVWNSGRQPSTTSSGVDVEAVHRRRDDVHRDVEVGDLGALGLPGGAAGVEDDGGVVGLARLDHLDRRGRRTRRVEAQGAAVLGLHDRQHGHAGQLRALGALAEQRRGADQRLRAGVGQDVLDLLGLEQRVHRHGDAAEGQHAEVGQREVRGVRQQQRDLVARADALLAEHRGVLLGVRPQLAVGEAQVAEHDRGRSAWRTALSARIVAIDRDMLGLQVLGRRRAAPRSRGARPRSAPSSPSGECASCPPRGRGGLAASGRRPRPGSPGPRCSPRSRRRRCPWSGSRSAARSRRPRPGRPARR